MSKAELGTIDTGTTRGHGLSSVFGTRTLKKLIRRFNRFSRRARRILVLGSLAFCITTAILVWVEAKSSILQSWYLSKIASELSFSLAAGPSSKLIFPEFGPYNMRLGYSRIPKVSETMLQRGFEIVAQSRMSERMLSLTQEGVFPTYESKIQAGLVVKDRQSRLMYSVLRPERLYSDFETIPQLVLEALLFIENKEVLDDKHPFKNPAIEWDRFFRATLENLYEIVDPAHSAPGGSTIATQLEKYRHSREGRTHSIKDKLTQMLSASLRAYQFGRDTRDTRRQVVHTYINSIPLAAFPGYGEVNGVGDGLWAWYATDFNSCNNELSTYSPSSTEVSEQMALCFRKVLSLFVAHRRPSFYLLNGRTQLGHLVNAYLRLMVRSEVIPAALGDAALNAKVYFRGGRMESTPTSFVDRKAVNAIRTGLSSLVGVPKMYDLDQMDLLVRSSIDKPAHDAVTRTLQRIQDPAVAKELGLIQSRLLSKGDPSKVTYSLTLFERTPDANLLRIQTDNFDGPFDINSGTRLDLGSTAKLRTLVTYLEVVEELYKHLAPMTPQQRESQRSKKFDPIGSWAISELNAQPKISLQAFLNAAMERTYSANPAESFFTGGGLHTFGNFRREDNGRVVSISIALRESINLPFVRLMRDIVRYYGARLTAETGKTQMSLNAREEKELRQAYLAKFADKEGIEFLKSFFVRYRGLEQKQIANHFLAKVKPTPTRIAAAVRLIYPNYSQEQFSSLMRTFEAIKSIDERKLESLYQSYGPDKFDLNDRGYLVRQHPLELWLVAYLEKNPEAGLKEIIEQSRSERQLVYKWLFKPSQRRAQDSRIKRLMEEDAFLPVYRSWKKSGYPFSSMVPSLASSIGSSGDRPSALAELMGIILNDGVRLPRGSIEQLHFAPSTPYETVFQRKVGVAGERIFSPEMAQILRSALSDVVENGTARRLKNIIKLEDGSSLLIGGKTGTGDHQFKQFGAGGVLISSRVVSRTATFVFFIGDRFFGTVTASVQGEAAGKYEFTSALAAEVLKAAAPSLKPLFSSQK